MAKSDRKTRGSAPSKRSAKKSKKTAPPKKSKKSAPRRRADWERNHSLIRQVVVEFLGRTKRMPKISEISEDSGLSYSTVQRHIRGVSLAEVVETSSLRIIVEDVLTGMARAGIGGNHGAARLFLEVVYGWTSKSTTELSGPGGGPIEVAGDFDRVVSAIQKLEAEKTEKDGGGDDAGDDG